MFKVSNLLLTLLAVTFLALGQRELHAASIQTENTGMRALPAPGPVTIDGKLNDWDLSGGIFACDDVISQKDKYALWIHLMYDEKNLYIAAHFIDPTPMNNPGQTIGDYGFQADCLQFRVYTKPDAPEGRVSHWTCWYGHDDRDVMDLVYGKNFNEGAIKDAKKVGAQQVFLKDADGKGYVQEIAIPWSMVVKEGQKMQPGERFIITFEPNFTLNGTGRLSVKDNFKPGITIDRVFTFQGPTSWGYATLEKQGKVAPQPVHLADGREFPVTMKNDIPEINWTGLVKEREWIGMKPITFTLPSDGYVSLNIIDKDGTVVRQLLNAEPFSKGEHTVKWDGLATWSVRKPGEPVAPGEYSWNMLFNTGIGLSLKGWACNAGNAPWDGKTGKENWGGDHGLPNDATSDGSHVYLGWGGAEAGKALVCADLQGNVQWRGSRQGMAGCMQTTLDQGLLYGLNWGDKETYVYRLNAKDGTYSSFEGTDSPDLHAKQLWPDPKGKSSTIVGVSAAFGKLYLTFDKDNTLMVVDGKTGKLIKQIEIKEPTFLRAVNDSLVYVISNKKDVLAVDAMSGQAKPFVTGLNDASGITTDKDGRVYVSVREPDQQVKVFDTAGKPVLAIGKQGGRAKLGAWDPEGVLNPRGMTVDAEGKLWVMEEDWFPKRISVWDSKSGKFLKEFFGPTSYGALGGSINPKDPNLMVGQGCEWKLDPKTGKANVLAVITRDGMENSRFAVGSNGKIYMASCGTWAFGVGTVAFYEWLGEAKWKLRGEIFYTDDAGNEVGKSVHGDKPRKIVKTSYWADENGDGQRQPEEITSIPGELRVSGWYMSVTPDLSLYPGDKQFKTTGFTSCSAPKYDLTHPTKMPAPGLGSPDGKLVLQQGEYGVTHGAMNCYDIASGKKLWWYPDNFVGVHGSHNACPPEIGMVRGSYGPAGSVKLPEPIGNAWIIATNVGEWHLLTEKGYYLTRLFEPDPINHVWPDAAVPGAVLDHVPCGMGGEDFGGSATLAQDGKLYLQAGKTGFWNIEVTGLDTVKEIKGGSISLTSEDAKQARVIHDEAA